MTMTEITSTAVEKSDLGNQKREKLRVGHAKNCHFTISQQEALRRATLLKHRKVSTQLKLDMVQRQLSELRNSSAISDRQFYRSQLSELSNELQDLGSTLEKVERNAFYARRRMLRCDVANGGVQLSASHPAIYSSSEMLDQIPKNGLKNKVHHLMSSPSARFKKKHLLGELRAVASLSNLHVKSNDHSSCDDIASKDSKTWRAPLRFLGHIMDNRICRRIWGSSKRAKSEDNLADDPRETRRSTDDVASRICRNGLRNGDRHDLSSSSSSESCDESDEEDRELNTRKLSKTHAWKGPVERKLSSSQKQQIDPAILAEIEDFEKMAAQYLHLHS